MPRIFLMTPLGEYGLPVDLDGKVTCISKPVTQSNLKRLINLDVFSAGASEATKDQPNRRARLLLVEDNLINQEVALGVLEDLGFEADIAENGAEAIDCLRKTRHPYDLILMDCQMPVMDGYKATGEIRSGTAGEAMKRVPIIAMTANAVRGDREKCLDAGMDDYLPKPIDPDSLEQKLNQWL
jgi:CheY-like chemotaxis protein